MTDLLFIRLLYSTATCGYFSAVYNRDMVAFVSNIIVPFSVAPLFFFVIFFVLKQTFFLCIDADLFK